MRKRRLVALVVATCCVGAAAVGLTRAAQGAPVTVPVTVGPSGMLVFNPVSVTAQQGDTLTLSDVLPGFSVPVARFFE